MTALFDLLTDAAPPSFSTVLPEILYRYMGADGLLQSINHQTLRLNAWSSMNDPRESKEWRSTGILNAAGGYTQEEMNKRLDDVFRRSARLMALTEDRPASPDASPGTHFHRGWGRAAMWAHYAQAHHGACLVLDTTTLNETLDNLPAVDGRYRTWGRIQYKDAPIEIKLVGTFHSRAALDLAIEAQLDRPHSIPGVHMTKNRNWQYESEVRIATIDLHLPDHELDTPLYVPLSTCLRGLIFGEAHPAPKVIANGVATALGPDAPEFFQCRWVNGAPQLHPLIV